MSSVFFLHTHAILAPLHAWAESEEWNQETRSRCRGALDRIWQLSIVEMLTDSEGLEFGEFANLSNKTVTLFWQTCNAAWLDLRGQVILELHGISWTHKKGHADAHKQPVSLSGWSWCSKCSESVLFFKHVFEGKLSRMVGEHEIIANCRYVPNDFKRFSSKCRLSKVHLGRDIFSSLTCDSIELSLNGISPAKKRAHQFTFLSDRLLTSAKRFRFEVIIKV